MKGNKIYKLLCSLWIIVPVLSLVRLIQPIITVQIDDTVVFSVVAEPVKSYNGFQLLIHHNLVNAYNDIVIDSKNPGLLILQIMIVLQLVCDAAIVCICLREWKEKQSPKIYLRIRGILSIGYVLTAVAIYRLSLVCVSHPKASVVVASYAEYHQEELEKNVLFSIAVVMLFLVTWSFCRIGKAYRRMCYFWILVPVLSLVILSRPMMVIETDDIYPITDVEYSGFQMLAYGGLTNEYKDLVIDRENLGFVIIKIMIALQLAFDVILIITALWEWGKKQNPKCFLCLRGGLAAGYVLTAVVIYQVAAWWSDNLEIEHDLDSFLTRTSYAFGDWGVYVTLKFSIAIVVLFAVSLLAFWLTSKKCTLIPAIVAGNGGKAK
ncbi:MAG: hypothetical protein K2J67_11625 [Lachnospiraceae bacterium]|nr:hypothetical protein [Lachnospiraceae bacterium]